MAKIKITPGDPQPVDCPNCLDRHGYQVSDNITLNYDAIYLPDGELEGGCYSHSMRVNHYGKTAACSNCRMTLPLRVLRT